MKPEDLEARDLEALIARAVQAGVGNAMLFYTIGVAIVFLLAKWFRG